MSTSDTPEKGASAVTYTRISTDSDGESHFSDEQAALNEADIAPPAPPVKMSEPIPAEGVSLVTLPAGWPGDVDEPHVSPARNYWFVLSGEMEITVSDGETRQFSQGDILFAEDTTGEGHKTRVVSESEMQFAVVEAAD